MRKVRIAQIGVNRYSHSNEIIDILTRLPDIFEFVGYALVEDERETCIKKIEKHYSMTVLLVRLVCLVISGSAKTFSDSFTRSAMVV